MTLQQKEYVIAYQKVVHLADTMLLQIDHRKSWHWGTGRSFRDSVQEVEEKFQSWYRPVSRTLENWYAINKAHLWGLFVTRLMKA